MCELEKTGIYSITNKINGKMYIGSTSVSFKRRFAEHKAYLNNYKEDIHKLKRSYKECMIEDWNKYGESNFEFKILKITRENINLSRLRKYESIYIIRYNSKYYGYNNVIRSSNEKITVRYDIYGENPKIIYFTDSIMNQNHFANKDGVGYRYSNFGYYYIKYDSNMIDCIPNKIKTMSDPSKLNIILLDADFNFIFKTSNRDILFEKIKSCGWKVPLNKKRLATPIRKFTFCNAQYFIIRESDIFKFIEYLSNKSTQNFKYKITGDINKLIKLSKEIV